MKRHVLRLSRRHKCPCLVRYQSLAQQSTSEGLGATPKPLLSKVEVKHSHKAWLARQEKEPFHQPDLLQQNPLSLVQALAPSTPSHHTFFSDIMLFLSYCPLQLPGLLPTQPPLLCPYSNYPFSPQLLFEYEYQQGARVFVFALTVVRTEPGRSAWGWCQWSDVPLMCPR